MVHTKKNNKKLKQFWPELGQACFGNTWNVYECPDFVEAGLLLLNNELCRVHFNIHQKSLEESPFGNCGGPGFKNKVFEIHPYYWGENSRLKMRPNFKCGSFEIRWYKYAGRGMSMNLPLDANEFFFIIDKCLKYLRDEDKKQWDTQTQLNV